MARIEIQKNTNCFYAFCRPFASRQWPIQAANAQNSLTNTQFIKSRSRKNGDTVNWSYSIPDSHSSSWQAYVSVRCIICWICRICHATRNAVYRETAAICVQSIGLPFKRTGHTQVDRETPTRRSRRTTLDDVSLHPGCTLVRRLRPRRRLRGLCDNAPCAQMLLATRPRARSLGSGINETPRLPIKILLYIHHVRTSWYPSLISKVTQLGASRGNSTGLSAVRCTADRRRWMR